MATMVADQHISPPTLSDAEAWRAVESRDAHYDGRFVYAVRSTMIYCRPSCPSRRPSRASVGFYDTPDDAERAGYRGCLRCRPQNDSPSATEATIERARRYLDRHAGRVVALSELASEVGLSTSHLQR